MIYHPVQYFSLSHKLIYPIKNILIIILFKTFLVTKINLPDKNIGLSTCSILFFATINKSMYLIKDRTVLLRNIFHCLSLDRPFKCCQAEKQGNSL